MLLRNGVQSFAPVVQPAQMNRTKRLSIINGARVRGKQRSLQELQVSMQVNWIALQRRTVAKEQSQQTWLPHRRKVVLSMYHTPQRVCHMSKWDENRETGGNALLKIKMGRVPNPYGMKNRLTRPRSSRSLRASLQNSESSAISQNQLGPYCEGNDISQAMALDMQRGVDQVK